MAATIIHLPQSRQPCPSSHMILLTPVCPMSNGNQRHLVPPPRRKLSQTLPHPSPFPSSVADRQSGNVLQMRNYRLPSEHLQACSAGSSEPCYWPHAGFTHGPTLPVPRRSSSASLCSFIFVVCFGVTPFLVTLRPIPLDLAVIQVRLPCQKYIYIYIYISE